VFGKDGLVQSGLFSDRKLVSAFDVTNQASGFLSISGNYTKDNKIVYKKYKHVYDSTFGEHNQANKLHGRGIYIFSDI